jgi:hypothetical protein
MEENRMKIRYALIPLAAIAFAAVASAQTTIYRCGNSYTNDRAEAQAKNCKAVEGGNITVVQGTRPNVTASGNRNTSVATAGSGERRIESGDQKARDNEARSILEAELKKAEARQAELAREFNNGEPEKLGPEHRNHQKYLDRVADMKAAIERNEKDIAGLKRELDRTSAPAAREPARGSSTAAK